MKTIPQNQQQTFRLPAFISSLTLKFLIPLAPLAMFLSGSGCGKTTTALPPIVQETKASPPQMAIEFTEGIFNKRFAKKGDTYYAIRVSCLPNHGAQFIKNVLSFDESEPTRKPQNSSALPILVSMQLVELRGVYIQVKEQEISEVDRLNSITWKGTFSVRAKADRRKDIDLIPVLKEMAAANGNTAIIPWTERPLSWNATHASIRWLFGSKGNQDDLVSMMSAFSGVDFASEVLNGYRGSVWGDWFEPKNNTYQSTYVEVRNGKVRFTNGEDPDAVLGANDTLTIFSFGPETGGILGMAALAEAEQLDFVIKPNMGYVEASGVLD